MKMTLKSLRLTACLLALTGATATSVWAQDTISRPVTLHLTVPTTNQANTNTNTDSVKAGQSVVINQTSNTTATATINTSDTKSAQVMTTIETNDHQYPVGAIRPLTELPLEEPSKASTASNYSLVFDANKNYESRTTTVNGQTISYRAYEAIPYVANPVDVTYQSMNIFIPEAYFQGQTINGYNSESAPIFLPNSVGGYMPGTAGTVEPGGMHPEDSANGTAAQWALSRGYIVAAPATRGRTNQATDGTYYGKAPAVIVDLQAAVAYLHANDKNMPGNANKIISDGTSAGGAVSLLLGTTGNHPDFQPYLEALGAAKADTSIFGVIAFCPITNLDNADKAYEWNFNSVTSYEKSNLGAGMLPQAAMGNQAPSNSASESKQQALQLPSAALGTPNGGAAMGAINTPAKGETVTLSEEDKQYSYMLKAWFPDYVNSLGLVDQEGHTLTLDQDGNGSFKDYVKAFIIKAALEAQKNGTDISSATYLIKDNQGHIVDLDWEAYNAYVGRQKAPGAFDSRANDAGENNEFGTSTIDNNHFTTIGAYWATNKEAHDGLTIANQHIIDMMNPMHYLGNTDANNAKHYYIRYGTKDANTSLAIPIIAGTKAQNLGYDVNMKTPYDMGHRGDYDLEEVFNWADSIVKQ